MYVPFQGNPTPFWIFQPTFSLLAMGCLAMKTAKNRPHSRGASRNGQGKWKKTAPRRVCLHTEGHRAPQWTRSCTLNGSYLRSAHFCNEQKGTEQTHRTHTVHLVHKADLKYIGQAWQSAKAHTWGRAVQRVCCNTFPSVTGWPTALKVSLRWDSARKLPTAFLSQELLNFHSL